MSGTTAIMQGLSNYQDKSDHDQDDDKKKQDRKSEKSEDNLRNSPELKKIKREKLSFDEFKNLVNENEFDKIINFFNDLNSNTTEDNYKSLLKNWDEIEPRDIDETINELQKKLEENRNTECSSFFKKLIDMRKQYDKAIFIYSDALMKKKLPIRGSLYCSDKFSSRGFCKLDKMGQSAFSFADVSLGWKLHIAIKDDKPVNLEQGWNIVMPILIDADITSFKIIEPNSELYKDKHQKGKQITIYHSKDLHDNDFWQQLVAKIEYELNQANIKSDDKAPIDKPITGSIYFSYRNDTGENGKYISSEKATSFNPSNKLDPFAGIILEQQATKNLPEESKSEEAQYKV